MGNIDFSIARRCWKIKGFNDFDHAEVHFFVIKNARNDLGFFRVPVQLDLPVHEHLTLLDFRALREVLKVAILELVGTFEDGVFDLIAQIRLGFRRCRARCAWLMRLLIIAVSQADGHCDEHDDDLVFPVDAHERIIDRRYKQHQRCLHYCHCLQYHRYQWMFDCCLRPRHQQ